MYGYIFIPLVLSLIFTPLLSLSVNLVTAQVMSSSNYQIQSDSVNLGGGFSSSSNYTLESTAGEVATGLSDSSSYGVRAGFQQTLESYISLSASGNVTLAPSIPGVSGGVATGSASVTVTTDSPGGYQLTIQSENSPAMQSGANTIADYSPGGDPDRIFTTGAADAHFGFSPEGGDIVQRYLDNGVICNQSGGSDSVDECWDGLSVTPTTIAIGSGSNHPVGTQTVIKFQVGIGGSVVQPVGNYVATTTITAVSL